MRSIGRLFGSLLIFIAIYVLFAGGFKMHAVLGGLITILVGFLSLYFSKQPSSDPGYWKKFGMEIVGQILGILLFAVLYNKNIYSHMFIWVVSVLILVSVVVKFLPISKFAKSLALNLLISCCLFFSLSIVVFVIVGFLTAG